MRNKLLAGLLAASACAGAAADPGYYLVTPYSQPGQAALDMRLWTVTMHGHTTMWPEAGVRYGVNSYWTTELLASFIGPKLSEQSLSSWNWQNLVLLTQGQYPFDVGVHLQLIHSTDDGNVLEWGPVFQTEVGQWQLNGNLIFEHEFADTGKANLKYQWQALYRLAPGWRAGMVGFGELGTWNHWSDQPSHRAGPTLRVGLGEKVELQAGYLFGKVYGQKARMFTADLVIPF